MLPLPILMTSPSPDDGQPRGADRPALAADGRPAVVVAAGMLLARRIEAGLSYWTAAFPAIAVLAAGMTIAVAPLTASVLGSVEEKHVGYGVGLQQRGRPHRRPDRHRAARRGAGQRGRALIDGFHLAMIGSARIAALAQSVAAIFLGGVKMRA